ncbi:MAG TPA: TRAM domain-containing protein [Thermoanaerobaculia bacterium]|nr:TRAM domain-containing protein [Thermoanaerobaculia bacterium]
MRRDEDDSDEIPEPPKDEQPRKPFGRGPERGQRPEPIRAYDRGRNPQYNSSDPGARAGDRDAPRGARRDRPAGDRPPQHGRQGRPQDRPGRSQDRQGRPPDRQGRTPDRQGRPQDRQGRPQDRPARPPHDRQQGQGRFQDRPGQPPHGKQGHPKGHPKSRQGQNRPGKRPPREQRGGERQERQGPPRERQPERQAWWERPVDPEAPIQGGPEPLEQDEPTLLTATATPPGMRLAAVEELEVEIEKMVAGGEGFARFEGTPIFVARSAPGDKLRVRLTDRRPDYGRAEIVEILEPGPARRPDPYPELSATGLCDLQHIQDDLQPRLKAEAVRETLERIGKIELPPDLDLITGEPWGYRLRTQVHTDVDPVTRGVRVGYHARGTHDVIPVDRCPLLVPELEALLAELPEHLDAESAPRRLDLAAGDSAVTLAPVVAGLPQGEVTTAVGDITYGYDARCFFQGHRGLLPRLVEAVVGPWEGEEAYDLYGGVGLFALTLARRYKWVVTVESERMAARYARNNVRRNRVEHVDPINQSVESWMRELPDRAARVVVDPPRGGISLPVRRVLMDRLPERITYVSCHAATLARDLRQMSTAYRVESLSLVDLFPQTGHMEAIVQLVQK